MISTDRPYHTHIVNAPTSSKSTSGSRPTANRQPRQLEQSLDSQHHNEFSAASIASNLLDDNDEAFAITNYNTYDSMQSDTWGPISHFTSNLGRLHNHQRESSLSSLGSAGPASPYNNNTSNPQIAVTDSTSDMNSHDNMANPGGSYYQLVKSMGNYPGYQNLDNSMSEMAYPVTIPGPGSKPRVDRGGLLPAPDFAQGAATRSHPVSVASSIAGDSPATPTANDTETGDRRSKGRQFVRSDHISGPRDSQFDFLGYGHVPKLDRTMTDIYGDELYNPNFAITSSSPSQPHLALSPHNDVFNQRINAANNHHLSAHSPTSTTSRGRSPFRTGSPLAPSPNHEFGTMPFNSAQRVREQARAQQDAQVFRQQMLPGAQQPETPKTISPKDAILEFNEPDGEANFPLFPQDPNNSFEMDQLAKVMMPLGSVPNPNGAASQLNYMGSQLPSGIQLPQQYPFIARNQAGLDTPPRLSSAGSSSVDSAGHTPSSRPRPMGTSADGGTYTCTYHGCTLRFESPSMLQKHKREGHRQTQGIGGPRVHDMGMAASLLNSQAGPHRCDRINPSTGKPCSTIFSRPYDLTRHEDTIHNARKQKVRCGMCTEEKTFSRADALTRHYRVCHPEVEVPGKHRRRGGV